MNILIVDDDALNLEILEEILDEAGFAVIQADGGAEALSLLEERDDIDIILLDRMMPDIDGMQVMEKIMAHPQWQNIPVIMQTAASSPAEVIEGSETGVFYYITKPFNQNMVLSIVRAAADKITAQKS